MEPEEEKPQHFPHCFRTRKTKWFNFSFEHLEMRILIVSLNIFWKNFVLELLNIFFLKFCPILEVDNRTTGDKIATIEQ